MTSFFQNVFKQGRSQGLLQATKAGDVAKVKYLAKLCPDLDIKDDAGNTPLMLLIRNCKPESTDDKAHLLNVCNCMVIHGTDVNAKNNAGMTSLMLVVSKHFRHNMIELMDLLVDNGANLDFVDAGGDTALIHALKSQTSIYFMQMNVTWLLVNGADPVIGVKNHHLVCNFLSQIWDFKSRDRLTLNHIYQLIKAGKVELLRLLVCNCALDTRLLTFEAINGDFPMGETLKGLSPLMLALLHNRTDIAKFFIANNYLTDLDLKREPKRLCKNLRKDQNNLVRKLYSQPWPLVKLCLLTVSALLGPLPERTDVIGKTKLPDTVKQLLVFQGPMSRVCFQMWKSLPVHACDYSEMPNLRPLVHYWPHGRVGELKCASCREKWCNDSTRNASVLDLQTKNTVDLQTKNIVDLQTKNTVDLQTKNTVDLQTKNTVDLQTIEALCLRITDTSDLQTIEALVENSFIELTSESNA